MEPGLCAGNEAPHSESHCPVKRRKKKAEPQERAVGAVKAAEVAVLSALPSLPSFLLHPGCDAYVHHTFRAQILKHNTV